MKQNKPVFDADVLRREIALIMASDIKSYNIPAACLRLGIQAVIEETDSQEAHRSKRLYVTSRLEDVPADKLVDIARALQQQHSSHALEDILSDIHYADKPISTLIRRDVLKTLNVVDDLFGERDLFEVLESIFGLAFNGIHDLGSFHNESTKEYILQHYVRNHDLTTEAMLIECGVLACSQTRFFQLLEEILHPGSRRDEAQGQLAGAISAALTRSGYRVAVTSTDSGYPVFGVVEQLTKVGGAMKNLIFASTGPKPELVFRDAINNDVEITKNAEHVLVYDQPLPPHGALDWKHLRDWWAQAHAVGDTEAKAQLFTRLQQSVRSAKSVGEYAIFRSYYKLYAPQLADKLPVLLPQVFLHYDPYTKRQRGDEQILARQRMDFLLMLEHGVRIVIEVDGRQHYATADPQDRWQAAPQKYAEMASEDRRLRLAGYEVYRFGGAEFNDCSLETSTVGPQTEAMLKRFFDQLLRKHKVLPN